MEWDETLTKSIGDSEQETKFTFSSPKEIQSDCQIQDKYRQLLNKMNFHSENFKCSNSGNGNESSEIDFSIYSGVAKKGTKFDIICVLIVIDNDYPKFL